MTPRKSIPIELARRLLDYNPGTGEFCWRERVSPRMPIGKLAGNINRLGYRVIKISPHGLFAAHRLAWAVHYGEQPPEIIDHINRCRADNRILNLRSADTSQSQVNRESRKGKSGYKGVCRSGRRLLPWLAKVYVRRKLIVLGCFETAEEAGLAYDVAADRFFGDFAPQPA